MPSQTKPDTIRRLFAAYGSRDRKTVEDLLTDDFRFTSPYDDAIDKATYFERCWPTSASDHIQSHVLEKVVEDGDDVFVLYKCTTSDRKEFRNTELFTFDGGRVRSISVYFGASYRDGTFLRSP